MNSKNINSAKRAIKYSTSLDGRGIHGIVAGVTDNCKNLFVESSGVRSMLSNEPMTSDTVFALYSCTKGLTATAALQCMEENLLTLDTPAKEFVPEIDELQVLEGFDSDGNPIYRKPKRSITVEMLLLHTAGFGYDFFNTKLAKFYAGAHGPSPKDRTINSLKLPLLFDPGNDWEYGISMDWAGLVVEAIRGKRLGDVIKERILEPLDMNNTGFYHSEAMLENRATLHIRDKDEILQPKPNRGLASPPPMDGGGGAIFGTVTDYLKFIRMWLNEGAGPKGRVLWPQTVNFASSPVFPANNKIANFPQINPFTSKNFEAYSGLERSWNYSFLVNLDDAHTGKPGGSFGWAGLANIYFWIDQKNRIGGMWASQILPFADKKCLGSYLAFEAAVYGNNPPILADLSSNTRKLSR